MLVQILWKWFCGASVDGRGEHVRRPAAKLRVETLEARANPSVVSDFWDVVTTDPVGGVVDVAAGVAQGGANLVNGVQDAGIGLANLPAVVYNNTAGDLGGGEIGYIESPDWSRDLIVEGDPLHGTSKFLGGNGAVILITAGAGTLTQGGRAAGEAGAVVGGAGEAGAAASEAGVAAGGATAGGEAGAAAGSATGGAAVGEAGAVAGEAGAAAGTTGSGITEIAGMGNIGSHGIVDTSLALR